jgi:hypothetical protein
MWAILVQFQSGSLSRSVSFGVSFKKSDPLVVKLLGNYNINFLSPPLQLCRRRSLHDIQEYDPRHLHGRGLSHRQANLRCLLQSVRHDPRRGRLDVAAGNITAFELPEVFSFHPGITDSDSE